MASSRKGLLRGLPRRLAQAAAKKAWLNRDLPNWRDRVGDLLKGKQIIVNGLREWNSIYVAARRQKVQALRFKISDSQFAVVAEALYDRKVEFIVAGNVYYTRREELTWLLKASTINKSANPQIVRVCLANNASSSR